jgi:hypothetical protein
MLLVQILLGVFLAFALSRVILRFWDKKISPREFFFWAVVFAVAIFVTFFPTKTSVVANWLGIGRGADLIIYASIAVLFYLVFRIYVYLEDLRHQITEVVRRVTFKKK